MNVNEPDSPREAERGVLLKHQLLAPICVQFPLLPCVQDKALPKRIVSELRTGAGPSASLWWVSHSSEETLCFPQGFEARCHLQAVQRQRSPVTGLPKCRETTWGEPEVAEAAESPSPCVPKAQAKPQPLNCHQRWDSDSLETTLLVRNNSVPQKWDASSTWDCKN